MDYYALIGVSRQATKEQIVAALNKKKEELQGAYHVLTNPQHKAIYDRGLNDSSSVPRNNPKPSAPPLEPQQSKPQTQIKKSSPNLLDKLANVILGEDVIECVDNSDSVYTLPLTLEQIRTGCKKVFIIKRTHKGFQEQRRLEIECKAGWKEGTKVTFNKNKAFSSDIVFIVQELPHPVFSREGDNLRSKCVLPKNPNGSQVVIPLLDGTTACINTPTFTQTEKKTVTFTGKGLPNSKTGVVGHLIVEFIP